MRTLAILAASLLFGTFGFYSAPTHPVWVPAYGPERQVVARAGLYSPPARVYVRGDDHDYRRFFFRYSDRVPVVVSEPVVVYGAGPVGGPPGWYRGRKVGWGGCGLPPGLARKYGCYGSGFAYRGRPGTQIFVSVR